MNTWKFTVPELRRIVASCAYPNLLQRFTWWIASWFVPASLNHEPLGDVKFTRFVGIIDSMTQQERENPRIVNHYRLQRIAHGSGTQPAEVMWILLMLGHDASPGIVKNKGDFRGPI